MRNFAMAWARFMGNNATTYRLLGYAIGAGVLMAVGLKNYYVDRQNINLLFALLGFSLLLNVVERYGFVEHIKELDKKHKTDTDQ